jgi:hypothetical protein
MRRVYSHGLSQYAGAGSSRCAGQSCMLLGHLQGCQVTSQQTNRLLVANNCCWTAAAALRTPGPLHDKPEASSTNHYLTVLG